MPAFRDSNPAGKPSSCHLDGMSFNYSVTVVAETGQLLFFHYISTNEYSY